MIAERTLYKCCVYQLKQTIIDDLSSLIGDVVMKEIALMRQGFNDFEKKMLGEFKLTQSNGNRLLTAIIDASIMIMRYFNSYFTYLDILLNTRTSGFEIEKSLAFSGVEVGLFKLSYITLYIIRIKTKGLGNGCPLETIGNPWLFIGHPFPNYMFLS